MNSSISSSDLLSRSSPDRAPTARQAEQAADVVAAARRFLLIVALMMVLGTAAAWGVTVRLGMGFLPAVYPMWVWKQQAVATCQLAPIVILGDSRANAGFNPALIPGSINLAQGGATPVEMAVMARNLLSCPNRPQRVLVSLSPGQWNEPAYFWSRAVLFGFLDFAALEDIRRQSRALNDSILYGPPTLGDLDAIVSNWMHAVRFPSYYTSYLVTEHVIGRLDTNRAIRQQTAAARGQDYYGTLDGSSDVAGEASLPGFKVAPLYNAMFERMLNDFAAKGIEVDYFAVPINQATFSQTKPELIADNASYLHKLATDHPNFHVNHDAVAVLDDRYFGDSTHLNQAGATKFSTSVAAALATW